MKNLPLFAFLLLNMGAYGQNDSILPNVYAHYTVQRGTGPFEYQRSDYVFYKADTAGDTMIVRNTDYSQWGNDTVGNTIDTLAYIALDGYKAYIKKVKFYTYWITFDEVENDWEPLYDFSLQVGDTACSMCYNQPGPHVVTSLDTIFIQGVPRKVLEIDGYHEWIQGMGGTKNPLEPMINYFEIGEWLCGAGMVYNGPSPIDSSYYEYEFGCSQVDELSKPLSGLKVVLYPNPAREFLSVRAEGMRRAAMAVYDLSGRVVYRGILGNEETRISTEGFAPGMYLMQLKSNSGAVTQKFVVE